MENVQTHDMNIENEKPFTAYTLFVEDKEFHNETELSKIAAKWEKLDDVVKQSYIDVETKRNEKYMFEKILRILNDNYIKQNIKKLEKELFDYEQDLTLTTRMLKDIKEVFIDEESYYSHYDAEQHYEDIRDSADIMIDRLEKRQSNITDLIKKTDNRLVQSKERKEIIEFLKLQIQKA
jgi:hypothetical protein